MRVRRRATQVAGILGAVAVSIAVGRTVYRRYDSDIRDAYAAVESADTESIETSLGTVEYRTVGEGVPVLVSHGIVGGFDQAIQTGEHLLDAAAQFIGVSRFGYLGSDLPEESTPENQARAYAELLDELAIDDVVGIGTSLSSLPRACCFPRSSSRSTSHTRDSRGSSHSQLSDSSVRPSTAPGFVDASSGSLHQ